MEPVSRGFGLRGAKGFELRGFRLTHSQSRHGGYGLALGVEGVQGCSLFSSQRGFRDCQ